MYPHRFDYRYIIYSNMRSNRALARRDRRRASPMTLSQPLDRINRNSDAKRRTRTIRCQLVAAASRNRIACHFTRGDAADGTANLGQLPALKVLVELLEPQVIQRKTNIVDIEYD